MSTDRRLRFLPRRSSVAVLGPGDEAGHGDKASAGEAHAKMLPAGHGEVDVHIRRFLVTLHIADRKNILLPLLAWLADPRDLPRVWRIEAFTVEASLSASLAGVGAVALVVRPRFVPGAELPADERLVELRRDLREKLLAVLPAGLVDDAPSRESVGTEPSSRLDVRPIDPGDDFRLYAGKHFREMRFGIDLRDGRWAGRCARLIERFAKALAERGVPLAYIHFPLHWDSFPARWDLASTDDIRWLRMAYAVEGDPSTDTGIELAAWAIAEDEHVALAAYEPTWRGSMEDRFVLLVPPAATQPADAPAGPGEPTTPSTLRTPTAPAEPAGDVTTIALGIEVLAQAGLLARLMHGMADARVYGCTMAVLHGHTMCKLIVDDAASRKLQAHMEDAPTGYTVTPHAVVPTTPIKRQSDEHDFAFWVAWCCGDAPGIIRGVIQAVDDVFRARGVDIPNVNYAISRVLVDGMTCAGKIELICTREEAARVGLVGRDDPIGRPADETLEGWAALRVAIRSAVAPALRDWTPDTREWLDRPVEVGDAEPSEQPWAWLVVPEGAVDIGHDAGFQARWVGLGDIPPGPRPPRGFDLGGGALASLFRRVRLSSAV